MLKKIATMMVASAIVASVPSTAFAQESFDEPEDRSNTPSWIMDTSGVGQSNNGIVRSNQILELGVAPANGLQLEGESMLRRGDLDGALVVLQRAVEQSPMDIEKRMLYSQALEKKLIRSKQKDPALYNFLVKQWLFIFKNAEFADQTMQAKGHIASLTGTVPKAFERERTFLARVLVPEIQDQTQKVADSKKKQPAN